MLIKIWEKILICCEKKIVQLIGKNFEKFKADGQAKVLRLIEQFIQSEKDQNNFWNVILF